MSVSAVALGVVIFKKVQKIRDVVLKEGFEIRNFTLTQNSFKTNDLRQGDSFDVISTSNTDVHFLTNIEIHAETGEAVTCFGNEFQQHEIFIG